MHGELASVREIVDLSAQEALNRAQAFLAQQGYTIAQRTDTWLTAERRPQEYTAGQHRTQLDARGPPTARRGRAHRGEGQRPRGGAGTASHMGGVVRVTAEEAGASDQ